MFVEIKALLGLCYRISDKKVSMSMSLSMPMFVFLGLMLKTLLVFDTHFQEALATGYV